MDSPAIGKRPSKSIHEWMMVSRCPSHDGDQEANFARGLGRILLVRAPGRVQLANQRWKLAGTRGGPENGLMGGLLPTQFPREPGTISFFFFSCVSNLLNEIRSSGRFCPDCCRCWAEGVSIQGPAGASRGKRRRPEGRESYDVLRVRRASCFSRLGPGRLAGRKASRGERKKERKKVNSQQRLLFRWEWMGNSMGDDDGPRRARRGRTASREGMAVAGPIPAPLLAAR